MLPGIRISNWRSRLIGKGKFLYPYDEVPEELKDLFQSIIGDNSNELFHEL
jgi:hypothetical protein